MNVHTSFALSEKLTASNLAVAALETSQVVSSKHAATASFSVVTYKAKVPSEHWPKLEALAEQSAAVVSRMLTNRTENSSAFYKEVPCVIAKGLSRKYQRNPKCKTVTRLCLPICGDKGKQVKIVDSGIRVPALFKKEIIVCQFQLPVAGFIRQVEFFKRSGDWFMNYTSRLRRKQSRRTHYENHRAAKTIVAFATEHRSAISLEDLKLTKGAKRYADKRQWAHAQLEQFIRYKAALRGVPIIMVNPAYTSQDCSRCGSRNKPNGKSYSCSHCGSKSHRDINAAFNIAALGAASLGVGNGLNVPLSGCFDAAQSGKELAI